MNHQNFKYFHPIKKPSHFQIMSSAFLGLVGVVGSFLLIYVVFHYIQTEKNSFEILSYLSVGLIVAIIIAYVFLNNTISYWQERKMIDSFLAFSHSDFIYYFYDKNIKHEVKEIIPIRNIYKIDESFDGRNYILKIYFLTKENMKKVLTISDIYQYESHKTLREDIQEEWQDLIAHLR